ncbi:MAG: glycosyl hydrolase family 8 [Pseudomonadota bacterium]
MIALAVRSSSTLAVVLTFVAALLVSPTSWADGARAPLHRSLAESPLWETWRSRFVTPEGRVVDTANAGISHSEGQGYGLLLAVAADDPETFARIFAFTRTELAIRDDGLLAWRWDPAAEPHVTDVNNATDGDLLVAWALHEAGKAGFGRRYADGAAVLVDALSTMVVQDARGRSLLSPGREGFGWEGTDGGVVNLSYWVFPALDALAEERSDLADIARTGRTLIDEAWREGNLTDWSRIDASGSLVPHSLDDLAPAYGYNAIRLPLYLAWAGVSAGEVVAASNGPNGPRLSEGTGYGALNALVACVRDGQAVPEDVRSRLDEDYYPATLQLLTLVALAQEHPSCL